MMRETSFPFMILKFTAQGTLERTFAYKERTGTMSDPHTVVIEKTSDFSNNFWGVQLVGWVEKVIGWGREIHLIGREDPVIVGEGETVMWAMSVRHMMVMVVMVDVRVDWFQERAPEVFCKV
jgi:hypothetical protein